MPPVHPLSSHSLTCCSSTGAMCLVLAHELCHLWAETVKANVPPQSLFSLLAATLKSTRTKRCSDKIREGHTTQNELYMTEYSLCCVTPLRFQDLSYTLTYASLSWFIQMVMLGWKRTRTLGRPKWSAKCIPCSRIRGRWLACRVLKIDSQEHRITIVSGYLYSQKISSFFFLKRALW